MNSKNNDILEGLRPRMQKARVAHVRRIIAGVVMVPLIGVGAAAMAAESTGESPTETAAQREAGADDAPEVNLPDIGDARDDFAVEQDDETSAPTETPLGVDDTEPEEQTKVLSLGPLGEAEVVEYEGELELVRTDLESGWELINVEVADGRVVVVVKNGDSLKIITITPGVRDEIDVVIEDLVFPEPTTTTTAPPPPTTEPPDEPPAPILDRFVVEVPGKGSFVVEREGNTLYLGDVTVNEGYEAQIQQAEGWRVYVKFTNGEWDWFGKALINDAGEIEQHFWDEQVEVAFEPIYQWVEVPGVGAVRFKLWSDGLVYVKEWESAEGISFYNYNGEAPAVTAKIDFEGVGVLWIVEAWMNEEGGLSWSTNDASPGEPTD